jgi:peptidoglycan/xylan/chitin deacetylase (PgdA/CDA1 family)
VHWLASGRVRVVSVQELIGLSDEIDAVALTFDDGLANIAEEAVPLLYDRGLPATLFVVTDHVGGDNRWRGERDAGSPVLPLLDWDALGRLRESGMTLAAHTRTHPNLLGLEPGAIQDELSLAADEMQRRLGERPEGLAYPYGAVNSRVASIAGRCYRWACTTEFRPLRSEQSPLLLPRLDAWYFRGPDDFASWGSPGFRARVWYRRQGRRARAAMRRIGNA